MRIIVYITLIILLVILSSLILIKNYGETIIGNRGEKLELNKNDLKECCKYTENGKEKTCSVLIKYSCDLCVSRCS